MQISTVATVDQQLQCDLKEYNNYFDLSCAVAGVVSCIFTAFSALHTAQGWLFVECNNQNMCRIHRAGLRPTSWASKESVDASWWEFLVSVGKLTGYTLMLSTSVCAAALAIFKKRKKLSQRCNHLNTIYLTLTHQDSEMVKNLPKELLSIIARQM